MKFRKPQWSGETAGRIYFDACMKLISDLPEEFEILGPGQTAINGEWPRELTKERLEQLCREAEAWQPRTDAIRAHADALEELARVRDELLGVKEYREKNPLGGPAKVFDAMADQIRAGEDFNKVIADYGWCPAERAERAEAALAECRAKLEVDPRTKYDGIDCRDETIRLLEAALAESERKGERLKFHAEAMAQAGAFRSFDEQAEAYYRYRAEFKE